MNNYISNQCMSCGYLQNLKTDGWSYLVMDLGENESEYLVLLTICPNCSREGPQKILEGYKQRIKSGADLNFH